MAVVVWVFAGGGYAEAEGVVPLLQQHFPGHVFRRRTPAHRKPGPRPEAGRPARRYAGNTGKALLEEIQADLTRYWPGDGPADLILVVDDSDCAPEPDQRLDAFTAAVQAGLAEAGCDAPPPIVPGLAVPELEVWLLGDWEATFAHEYRRCEKALQQTLSRRGLRLSEPESFPCRTEAGEYVKLTEDVLLPALETECQARFSKATDTPRLLMRARPAEVKKRCPYFRQFWNELEARLTR